MESDKLVGYVTVTIKRPIFHPPKKLSEIATERDF